MDDFRVFKFKSSFDHLKLSLDGQERQRCHVFSNWVRVFGFLVDFGGAVDDETRGR